MEVILIILAATYAISGKHKKDTSLAAYRAGKEPEGLVKARMRHERGGGRFVTRPGKDSKPKGPGATRLLIASRWAGACEKSKTKGEDKVKRWKAWYEEQAPQRDQAWRDKQNRKIEKRSDRLDRWQGRWTRTKNATQNVKDAAKGVFYSVDGEESESTSAGNTTEQPAEQQPAQTESAGEDTSGQSEPAANNAADAPGGAGPPQQSNTTTNTSTGSGDIVEYKQAAAALRAAAERVEQYRVDLSAMADGLGGKKWGEEVHGTIRDMDNTLHEIAGDYRDMAGQMQQEGDNVADAEDAHPYVPGPEVVNA